MPLFADMSAFTQVSGVKVYQPGGSQADEIIIEFDFMWSGQQVTASGSPVSCLIRASILIGKFDCGCPLESVRRVSWLLQLTYNLFQAGNRGASQLS